MKTKAYLVQSSFVAVNAKSTLIVLRMLKKIDSQVDFADGTFSTEGIHIFLALYNSMSFRTVFDFETTASLSVNGCRLFWRPSRYKTSLT